MGWVVFGEDTASSMTTAEFLSAASFDVSGLPEYNGFLAGLLFILCLYLLYYLTFVVQRPQLCGGGHTLQAHLLAHCPTLSHSYWPTIWAFNRHIMTIGRCIVQRYNSVQYRRTIETMPDGGEVGLDWGVTEKEKELPRDSPLLLILPGIAGTSEQTYVKFMVEDGINCGYRPVVFLQRGTGGMRLKTYRLFCATKIDDLQNVLKCLRESFPLSDVVAVGVSLGGMFLTQYLHRTREHSIVKAAMVVSCAWDIEKSGVVLEGQFLNRNVYIRHLVRYLTNIVETNAKVISEGMCRHPTVDINHILECRTFTEFNRRLICPMFGYRCHDDYHAEATNGDKIHLISTPLVCLSATDDPFVPPHTLPVKAFSENPHTLLVTVSSGGHNGFLEGLLPTSHSWMNRVLEEFLVAMRDYKH